MQFFTCGKNLFLGFSSKIGMPKLGSAQLGKFRLELITRLFPCQFPHTLMKINDCFQIFSVSSPIHKEVNWRLLVYLLVAEE